MVVEITTPAIIATAINVDHDTGRARARARSSDGGFEQGSKLRPVLATIDIDLALRPEHPTGNFISGLHHVSRSALPCELSKHIACIVKDRIGKSGEVLALPALWRG